MTPISFVLPHFKYLKGIIGVPAVDSSDEGLLEYACLALANLALNDDNPISIAEVGAIPKLSKLLDQFPQ